MTAAWPFSSSLVKAHQTLLLILIALLIAQSAEARGIRKKRHRPARPAPSAAVFTATPEMDERVKREVKNAEAALIQLEPATLLANPYVVQAVYFSDTFLRDRAEDRPDADPSMRITSHLCRMLTPERKAQYLRMLREVYAEDLADVPERPMLAPVPLADAPSRGRRRTHADAVDLFTDEGTPVMAAARGVVILAQDGWNPDDPFSTSSVKGGNTVIVFDPAADRFYRYAHLASVSVNPGTLVEAGQPIGTVGHTGWNAARPGHGRHLHFEINQHEGGVVRAWNSDELWTLLQNAQPILSAYGYSGME